MKKNIGIVLLYLLGGGLAGAWVGSMMKKPSVKNFDGEDAKSLADQLFDAFDGWGTKTDVVFNIFSQLSDGSEGDNEFISLSEAYGTRTISSGRFNPMPDFTGNLVETIRQELSSSDIDKLNDLFDNKNFDFQLEQLSDIN